MNAVFVRAPFAVEVVSHRANDGVRFLQCFFNRLFRLRYWRVGTRLAISNT